MTFLSRRKLPITRRAPIRCAWTAISLAAGWLALAANLSAQSASQTKYAPIEIDWPAPQPIVQPPAEPRAPQPPPPPPIIRNETVVPVRMPNAPDGHIKTVTFSRPAATQALVNTDGVMKSQVPSGRPGPAMDSDADYFRTDLPGADRLFERKSERQFYDSIRAEAQARGGGIRPIFPERVPVSKEKY